MDQNDRITYLGNYAEEPRNPTPQAATPETGGGESVDRIREIIFGGQMRDYDRRFARLEEKLSEQMNALRDETRARFESLEIFIKQELDALSQRISRESADRNTQSESVLADVRRSDQELDRRIAALDEQHAKLASALRDLVLDQSKTLLAEMQQKHLSLSNALSLQGDTLREAMTDRRALADLFTELSLRLKKEMDLPGRS